MIRAAREKEIGAMGASFDPTIIVFAVLAIFVVWKLRAVLGSRTGTERPPTNPFAAPPPPPPRSEAPSNVVRLPGAANSNAPATAAADAARWQGVADPGSKVGAGLDAIAAQEPGFAAQAFLQGAVAAHEMIIMAFAAGDRKTLQPLLSTNVFEDFSAAIAARETRGETVNTTFVSVDPPTVEDAQWRDGLAQITVKIASKLITATRDRAGTLVEGNGETVAATTDLWTFGRQTGSADPNWKLLATESVH